MAVARKIKTLLTVNILVFVGIILFSVYCRIQDRSQELVQIVRSAERRARSRGAKVGSLADRESILQRLDHLEEVVYNQLNGTRGGEGCPVPREGAAAPRVSPRSNRSKPSTQCWKPRAGGDAEFCWRGWSSLSPLSPCLSANSWSKVRTSSIDAKFRRLQFRGLGIRGSPYKLYQALPGSINSAEEVVCIANAMLDCS